MKTEHILQIHQVVQVHIPIIVGGGEAMLTVVVAVLRISLILTMVLIMLPLDIGLNLPIIVVSRV